MIGALVLGFLAGAIASFALERTGHAERIGRPPAASPAPPAAPRGRERPRRNRRR